MAPAGGGGKGGWGTGANTNHKFHYSGSGGGYGNTAPQNGINQGNVTFQCYLFPGQGGNGGRGGNGSGNSNMPGGAGDAGSHRPMFGVNTTANQSSGLSGDAINSPTSGGYGNLKHANTSSSTLKGGGGAGGHGGQGGAWYAGTANGTGNNGSTHAGVLPQSGCVIIYAYNAEKEKKVWRM